MNNNALKAAKPVIILLIISAALIGGMIWLLGLGTDSVDDSGAEITKTMEAPLAPDKLSAYDVNITNNMNPIAVMKTNKGIIEIELFENIMPITAGNFVNLAEKGFYDGVKFHRVIDGFMIQGGDPITKTNQVLRYGTGGPDYTIPDEHISHELLSNVRGTISMANSGPESGGSQFFINLVDNVNLDFDKPPFSSKHPVFGRVVEGMNVVDTIGGMETNASGLPLDDVIIESVTIRKG